MNIYIPDDINGKERRRLLKLMPVQYALTHCNGNLAKAADWLGITRKWIYEMINDYPELNGYQNIDKVLTENVLKLSKEYKVRETNFYKYATPKERRHIDAIITLHNLDS